MGAARDLFDGRWRQSMERGMRPVGSGLQKTGVTADQLTALGLGMAVCTAVAIGRGELRLGLVLLALSSVPDMLDGAVAKASGTASPRGAFFDSVADRVSDALVLGGVGWHLATVDGGHAVMLPFAVLGTSMLISYERARAESLGYSARGGLMERAERIVMLGIGLAFPAILVPLLWAMLALTAVTAVQRFFKVWRQATAPAMRRTPEWRWRAWRDSMPRTQRSRDRMGRARGGAHGTRRWRVRTRP